MKGMALQMEVAILDCISANALQRCWESHEQKGVVAYGSGKYALRCRSGIVRISAASAGADGRTASADQHSKGQQTMMQDSQHTVRRLSLTSSGLPVRSPS